MNKRKNISTYKIIKVCESSIFCLLPYSGKLTELVSDLNLSVDDCITLIEDIDWDSDTQEQKFS